MSTEREPFLIEAMRKKPTGDIRHNPGRGALGTSAAGFLAELDEYLAARDRRVRAEAWDEAVGSAYLHETEHWMGIAHNPNPYREADA